MYNTLCVHVHAHSFIVVVSLFLYRLCTMTMTRLHVLKPLENELTSIVVAVKMQVCPFTFNLEGYLECYNVLVERY